MYVTKNYNSNIDVCTWAKADVWANGTLVYISVLELGGGRGGGGAGRTTPRACYRCTYLGESRCVGERHEGLGDGVSGRCDGGGGGGGGAYM